MKIVYRTCSLLQSITAVCCQKIDRFLSMFRLESNELLVFNEDINTVGDTEPDDRLDGDGDIVDFCCHRLVGGERSNCCGAGFFTKKK